MLSVFLLRATLARLQVVHYYIVAGSMNQEPSPPCAVQCMVVPSQCKIPLVSNIVIKILKHSFRFIRKRKRITKRWFAHTCSYLFV